MGASATGIQVGVSRVWRSVFHSDLLRRVSATYATQLLNIVVAFATAVVITRSLGPHGRGIYAVAIAIGALGVQLSNAGFHFANIYHVAHNRSLLSTLLGNTFLVSFGLGGLLAFLAWAFFAVKPNLAPVRGLPLAIGLLWIPFGLALMLTENLLLGLQETGAYNTVEALSKLATLVLAISVVLSVRPQPEWFLIASFTALLLSLGTAVFKASRFVQGWPRPSLTVLRNNLPLGLKAYFIMLFSFLVLRIDLLMVKYMLGTEPAGYYSVAANMADVCLALPMAISTVLFPKLCGMADLRQRFFLTLLAGVGIAVVLGLTLLAACLLAGPMVILAFGRPFLPAALAFVWLAPGVLTLGIEIVIVQFLNSLGIPNSVIGVWLLSTVANISANLWAIPRFGILGASAVSSITYMLTFALILLTIVRTKSWLSVRA